MSRKNISNPDFTKFLIECNDKETNLACKWFQKNRERLIKSATLREPKKYFETDVYTHIMAEGIATISRDHVTSAYNRRKLPIRDAATIPTVTDLNHGHSIVDVGLGDSKIDPRFQRPGTDLSFDPIMRPMDPEIRKIIYKGRPEFGREKYLEKRTKVWPEKKYYFSECRNWDYGWRTSDSALKRHPAEYGRYWHLARARNSRVGPQPDPSHYASANKPTSTKCIAN